MPPAKKKVSQHSKKVKTIDGKQYLNGDLTLPKGSAQFEWTDDQIMELARCRQDIIHFAENYFFINTIDYGNMKIKLYDFQKEVLRSWADPKHRFNLLCTSRQLGKALDVDTPIPTTSGFKRMGDLVEGDELYGSDGKQCKVTHAWEILYNRNCYEIEFSSGEKIVADENHNWFVYDKKDQTGKKVTTGELLEYYDDVYLKGVDTIFEILQITPVESRPVRCITVDSPDSLFLCGKTHIPTSNTTITTIIALWLAFFSDNPQKIYILANKEDTAKGILERIKLAYRNMPNWVKAGVDEYTKTNIVFSNESTIKIAPTSTDAIRGVSASCILLDEMAFIRPEIQKAFFESVMPTMSSSKTGKIIAVSTPNGVLNSDGSINSFYLYYSKAELKEGHREWNGWYSSKAMWYEVPGRDEEWKVSQLRTLNNDYNKWRQEFCCEFLESGAAVLGTDILERMKSEIRKPIGVYEDGSYRVFDPPKKNHLYVIGVDTSEGVGADASVAVVLDITDLTHIRMVAEYWTNTMQPYVFAEKLNKIRRNWNYPYLAIERNNTGGQVIDALYNVHHYHNIIHYTMENDTRGFYQNMGIFSHSNSKHTGIMNMRYWMDVLEAMHIPDLAMLQEFETFVRRPNGTWGAQKGFHDDRIMSLVWALVVLETKICERYYTIEEYDNIGKPSKIYDPNHMYGQELAGFESEFTGLSSPPVTLFTSMSMPNTDAYNEIVELTNQGWTRY